MKKFSELNIQVDNLANYIGKQIKVFQIFNKEIELHKFKIEPSKKNESILLTIQIKFENEYRIIFCGSKNLANILKTIPENEFPFTCEIINESSGYNLN
jgi:hypothetical protein